MPSSAFFAVFRNVAKLAAAAADDVAAQGLKLAAAADDVAVMTGRAAAKTAGIAADDLAVGASKLTGVSPAQELPAIWRIFRASALNKIWLIALVLAVDALLPLGIQLALVAGGLYLAFEGGKAVLERLGWDHGPAEAPLTDEQRIRGAIVTDIVLSLEILVISLTVAAQAPFEQKLVVLTAMSVVMTVGIYGVIAALVRLDDIGLALVRAPDAARQAMGRRIVWAAPRILGALGPIGMVAMLAVAGGIFTHLVHFQAPHWTLGMAVDITVGAVVGVALAAAGVGFQRLASRSARTG
jgi:predicted DNA repair protein MutK